MQERGWVVEGWGHAGERMGGEGWDHTEKGGIDKEESGMLIMHTHTPQAPLPISCKQHSQTSVTKSPGVHPITKRSQPP